MNLRKNIYTHSMRQVTFCWYMITTSNRIVSHYNTGCFVREKVFWDLLQNFTEQLICCIRVIQFLVVCHWLKARPLLTLSVVWLMTSYSSKLLACSLEQTPPLVCLLQSFIFCIGFCFKEIGFPVSILFQHNQKTKSDLLLIQDRSHFKYHQERNVLQLILWFMTTPFRTITIYTFIYRVSWCHIFGKVTGQCSMSQFSLHQKTFSRTGF